MLEAFLSLYLISQTEQQVAKPISHEFELYAPLKILDLVSTEYMLKGSNHEINPLGQTRTGRIALSIAAIIIMDQTDRWFQRNKPEHVKKLRVFFIIVHLGVSGWNFYLGSKR